MMQQLLEKAAKIKCLICDMDGVLTDGLIYLDNQGNESKAFHIQDGMGLKLLMCADIEVAIITTARNKVVEHRMQQLGISHYFTNQVDKQNAYQTLKSRLHLEDEQFAYIGDDLPDLPLIQRVGLGAAVANAVPQIKAAALWTSQQHGGRGGVRELCDFILTAQGKCDTALERYLRS